MTELVPVETHTGGLREQHPECWYSRYRARGVLAAESGAMECPRRSFAEVAAESIGTIALPHKIGMLVQLKGSVLVWN